ncbi:hypothetical protein AHAS_Ahas10G0125600 [Arachis hypogaea]|uniref:ribose-5-phosphate isomerase n=1 Tax=Arachis hypogaea TaxID=3818 RepID=A0A445B745_ARAHY|nr:hypothetical protein Ahy_A10g049419 [Arachis hypogaea]
MVFGFRTGSTTKHDIDRISELLYQSKFKDIVRIPTSKKMHEQVLSYEIPLSDLDSYPLLISPLTMLTRLILTLTSSSGAVAPSRKKMVEGACKKFIVIVNESKLVNYIGDSGLAMFIEVIQFYWKFTISKF